jgi:hypothetical protein
MQLKKGETRFEQASAGDQPGVISRFEDLGTRETKFGDKSQCQIVYVLAETDQNGRQKRVAQTLNASLNEKSTLSAVLTGILGEVPEDFNSDILVGKQVLLTFGVVTRDGKERVRLYAVKAAPPGQNVQIPSGK